MLARKILLEAQVEPEAFSWIVRSDELEPAEHTGLDVLLIEGSCRTARLLTLERPNRSCAVGPKRMIGWLIRLRSTKVPTSEA
jgi:hypothetical protein